MAEYQGDLLIGGAFDSIHDADVRGVARWDGERWGRFGIGPGIAVTDMVEFDGRLVVLGEARRTGKVKAWSGESWETLGTFYWPMATLDVEPPDMRSMIVFGDRLIVAGDFDRIDQLQVQGIAAWDGATWSAFGEAAFSEVDAVGIWRGALVASGPMIQARNRRQVATWDGQRWTPLFGAPTRPATFFYEFGGDFWAGFRNVTESWAAVQRWDGSTWSASGWGLDRATGSSQSGEFTVEPRTIWEYRGALHVAGHVQTASQTQELFVARWDGAGWTAVTDPSSPAGRELARGTVNDVLVRGDSVVLGGAFSNFGVLGAGNVVGWDAERSSHVVGGDTGLDSVVLALASHPEGVLVAGRFREAGTLLSGPIALWNGEAWEALGSAEEDRLRGTVRSVLVDGFDVVASGSLALPDGSTAPVARWDGSTWSGSDGAGTASGAGLVRWGSRTVLAAGNRIFEWAGTTWEALGDSLPAGFSVLQGPVVFRESLYVTALSNTPQPLHLALFRREGEGWVELPSLPVSRGYPTALAAYGDHLWLSGSFGESQFLFPSLLRWDGTSWEAAATDIDGSVDAFLATPRGLYVGGSIRRIDGQVTHRIALWKDSEGWIPLTHGWIRTGDVTAILTHGDDLWLGGTFSDVEDRSSARLAVWRPGVPPEDGTPPIPGGGSLWVHPNPFNPATQIRFELETDARAKIEIFGASGRRVNVVLDRQLAAGSHSIAWDGRDATGRRVASGVYFVRVAAAGRAEVRKVCVVR